MDEVAERIVARVRAARAALAEAAGGAGALDSARLRAALDELEEALRDAHVRGVEVPPAGAGEERKEG